MWAACKIVAGVLLVAFAFREIFQDLFHPTRVGSLSDFIARTVFGLLRRRPRALNLAGPLALVIVVLGWALLQAVGFALIYWGAFPGGFRMENGQSPRPEQGFWLMLYFSLQAMTTLGLGDLLPVATWLRILVTFQALTGFALVTASVSWVVLLYPALGRMRTLARRASTLAKASRQTGVDIVSGDAQYLLGDLALEVIRTRVDLIHFPIIYYFHSGTDRASLPESLPQLSAFADAGCKQESPERVRLASAALRTALDDLAKLLANRFVRADSNHPDAVFRAYAEHHVTRIAKP